MTALDAPRTGAEGLDDDEVAERVAAGRVNVTPEPPGRSFAAIVSANVLTPVNAIMLVLFVLVLVAGEWRDGLFVGVVVSNSVVGVVQEVRARRELARLEVVTAARATVVRAGEKVEIDTADIVHGDFVELSTGEQASVDGEVVTATGLRMDESMLTGESDPVGKEPGDTVMSGSFVVAGSARAVTTAVGADSYAAGLAGEAKRFDEAESELRGAVDRILRWLTVIIPVAGSLLLVSLLRAEDTWQAALQGTVAAAVAMVPDGLVLLTSLAFVAGMLELTRRNALAKQLTTVEVLARVDVLCLDKTGTITTGEIRYVDVHPLGETTADEARAALAAIGAADDTPNPTMAAIVDALADDEDPGWSVEEIEPFSSARKWSAVSFAGRGWYYVGAPDFLLADDDPAREVVGDLGDAGRRLLALVTSDEGPDGDEAPAGSAPAAIVELEDEIRPDAPEILEYFAGQGVTVKVISGDNHESVAAIARRAGLVASGDRPIEGVDARTLPEDADELADALEAGSVFGRVAPRQKQEMVRALRSRGRVVAMTGDGVNDVLALKEADLGISMGSGSEATRAVADLVLTDDSFASLPTVVTEGRKVINNVERVANLFVTKATYAVLLTLAIGAIGTPFPFLPRQLTLIGTFSIGIPGFFLALAPEEDRVRTGFLRRVLRFSLPAGTAAGAATFATYELVRDRSGVDLDEARTLATLTLLAVGLVVLAVVSRPLSAWKVALVAAMGLGYAAMLAIPLARRFFELDLTSDATAWLIVAIAASLAGAAVVLVGRVTDRVERGDERR
ncbi:HAD-IC family P-type ATPase [Ilumatobacter sp.]|uniref:HAD-IC family P-type ATPase n=1 Tax=Ilumatobacter sp. TaxID=1967498 RepID=UPI003B52B629